MGKKYSLSRSVGCMRRGVLCECLDSLCIVQEFTQQPLSHIVIVWWRYDYLDFYIQMYWMGSTIGVPCFKSVEVIIEEGLHKMGMKQKGLLWEEACCVNTWAVSCIVSGIHTTALISWQNINIWVVQRLESSEKTECINVNCAILFCV